MVTQVSNLQEETSFIEFLAGLGEAGTTGNNFHWNEEGVNKLEKYAVWLSRSEDKVAAGSVCPSGRRD